MATAEVEILLVEDDPADAELTLHALRCDGLASRVHVARDGEEALDFLYCRGVHGQRDPAQRPKLILLDLKLPKADGIAVLEQIKNDPLLKAVPVIVITSSREDRDMIHSYQLGANSYIQKPLDFDEFRATIKQLGLYWLRVNVPPPAGAFPHPEPSRDR